MASPKTIEVNLANKPGECVSVLYTADEPIYNIIQRIAMELQETKANYNYQELYLEGFHLEYPHLPLAHYRVLGGTLTYQSIKKGDMSIFVKSLSGSKSHCISCNPSDTILDIKKILVKREGIPLAQQLLWHRSSSITDDDATLESSGIRGMSTLTISTRVRGGLGASLSLPIQFADVSSRDNVKNIKLATYAPPGRVVYPGTNFEAYCSCTPKYRVISPVHFGTIEISQEKVRCPNCESSHRTVPVSVGFRMCKYRFHGLKADSTQFSTNWSNTVKSNDYQLFDPKKQIGWTRLVIESAPLDGEDDCPLCLQRMDEYDEVETLECGHRFHEYCQTLRKSDTCSSCDFQHVLLINKKNFLGGLRLRLSQ
ncbi:hypothetical protein BGZ89_003793 [Linnemannia elongata]|nr:hypothetical protein BGZ89_003793 [Linnemannia elongata]